MAGGSLSGTGAASAQIASAWAMSAPSSAAMAPSPAGTACCIDLAAQFQQPGGVGDVERAGGGQGGVLAERMAGNDHGLLAQGEAAFLLQHTQHGERVGHQGGLGVLGEDEFLAGAFEHQPGQLLA